VHIEYLTDGSLDELLPLLKDKAVNRMALVIADSDVFLNSPSLKCLYVLELAASNAAGGRGAGYGSREVSRVCCFEKKNGSWVKTADVSDRRILEGFEPPHYVSLLPLILDDGSEIVVYGAVDAVLIAEYNQKFLHT